jgi:hypothetical protein
MPQTSPFNRWFGPGIRVPMETIDKATAILPQVESLHLRNEVDDYYGVDAESQQRQNQHHDTYHRRQVHQTLRHIDGRRGRLSVAHGSGIPSFVRTYSRPGGS